jgi:hypothetical protein
MRETGAMSSGSIVTQGSVRGFRDPWPSSQSAWNDPPWILEGRVVTAWFSTERARLAAFLSPDLMPRDDGTKVRSRIRFYDLSFRDERHGENPFGGRFREAVVAFAGRAGTVDGEVSLFMWTDDDTYMLWGREVFGWPLERAAMSFDQSFWHSGTIDRSDLPGSSVARCAAGEIGLRIDEASEAPGLTGPGAMWITPRRVLWPGRSDGDTREVLLVKPEIMNRGQRYEAHGQAWLNFRAGHPLADLPVNEPTFEIVDGVRLRVGADVKVLAEAMGKERE